MFTEQIMHEHPTIIKAFMGIPAEVYELLVKVAEEVMPEVDRKRLERANRQRGVGAGRPNDQTIAIRVAGVLTYLRLHAPQIAVGMMYGGSIKRIFHVICGVYCQRSRKPCRARKFGGSWKREKKN